MNLVKRKKPEKALEIIRIANLAPDKGGIFNRIQTDYSFILQISFKEATLDETSTNKQPRRIKILINIVRNL